MGKVNRAEVERRLGKGESLRTIAKGIGVTYQTLQYHRRRWGLPLLRAARTSGESHASWRGGTFIDQWGYRMVVARERGQANPYVHEHVLIAEKTIGRRLKGNEVVHHINGVKDDNRPENLLVMTRAEHKKLHAQLEALAFILMQRGQIIFADGAYQVA